MRILIDENAAVQLVPMLRALLPGHDIQYVRDIKWSGKKDLALLPDAARRGFDVFLTKDNHQMDDPFELEAIKKSGMHHIRFSQTQRGKVGLGLAMGAVIAAAPIVIEALTEAQGQRLVHIKGLNPGAKHRFDLVNPAKEPPTYWPR